MTATFPKTTIALLVRRSLSRTTLHTSVLLAMLFGVAMASTQAQAAPAAHELLTTANALQLDGKININTASSDELRLLPGVGPATAAKILAYRIRRPFGHPTHLLRIKGIGRKTFNTMRRYLTVEGETTLHVPADP